MGVRISSIFLPVDVEAIMRIRVPERIMNDQIAWHYEKSGQFPVKSAYKLALKLQSQDQMASSSNPKQREKLCKGMPRISRRTGCKVFKVCRMMPNVGGYKETAINGNVELKCRTNKGQK